MMNHTPIPGEPPNRRTRILVVDDHPRSAELLAHLLRTLGYTVVVADGGQAALKAMQAQAIDLVLLDLFMPEMDGCEVCARLKANPCWAHIPVIFLSGSSDSEMMINALQSGGVDFVTKPFHKEELAARVRTHVALKATADALSQLALEKDEILGVLAHDLSNHLGSILLNAQALRQRLVRECVLGNPEKQLATNIERTSGYLLSFVREFLANSSVTENFDLPLGEVDLAKVAMEVVENVREAAERKGIRLEARLEGPIRVIAHASSLTHVIDNLLSNAIKFSSSGQTITVQASVEPAFVQLAISDEGPGFTAEDRTRMYSRYARLSARPSNGEPSTGLGLSIVHRLVRAMKGEICCESEPGRGATFRIDLPRPL